MSIDRKALEEIKANFYAKARYKKFNVDWSQITPMDLPKDILYYLETEYRDKAQFAQLKGSNTLQKRS